MPPGSPHHAASCTRCTPRHRQGVGEAPQRSCRRCGPSKFVGSRLRRRRSSRKWRIEPSVCSLLLKVQLFQLPGISFSKEKGQSLHPGQDVVSEPISMSRFSNSYIICLLGFKLQSLISGRWKHHKYVYIEFVLQQHVKTCPQDIETLLLSLSHTHMQTHTHIHSNSNDRL